MKKLIFLGLVLGMATLAQAQTYVGMTGLWEFNDSSDLTKATVGNDLVSLANGGGAGSETATSGIVAGDGAVLSPLGSYFQCDHGISANGGGSWVNEFTLLFDVKYPEASTGSWRAFYNTNWSNSNDSEYFIHPSDESWGVGDLGYTDGAYGTFFSSSETWYRVVMSVNLETDTSLAYHDLYIDGVKVDDHKKTALGLDGRFSLYTKESSTPWVVLCGDNDGDDAEMHYSNIAIWNRPLDATEAAALGTAGNPIPEPATMALLGLGGLALIRRKKS
ncbi:MAG: PEP-CTERM sorting domain-containing protein [Sedimentisphaerales bacterium]|nr:PEP-CTERM sorting domain-containing protein [Sedimentisphaerales bacterium]